MVKVGRGEGRGGDSSMTFHSSFSRAPAPSLITMDTMMSHFMMTSFHLQVILLSITMMQQVSLGRRSTSSNCLMHSLFFSSCRLSKLSLILSNSRLLLLMATPTPTLPHHGHPHSHTVAPPTPCLSHFANVICYMGNGGSFIIH